MAVAGLKLIVKSCRVVIACNIGTLKIRIGFSGPLYYNHNKELVLVII